MWLRQDRMTNQERLEALFHYRKPDRIPIGCKGVFEFGARNCGYSKVTCYIDAEKSFYAQLWTCEQYGWDHVPFYLIGGILRGARDFGGEEKLPESEYQMSITFKSRPVNTEEDIAKLKVPDPRTAGRIQAAKEFARLAQRHGIPAYIGGHPPFGMAADICGLDRFCRWMVKKPELCHAVAKLALAHYLGVIEDWVATFGPQNLIPCLFLSLESNQLFSGKQFEKFALPYHVQLQDRLKAMGIEHCWIHFCGDHNLNLPYLAEFSGWPHPSILSFGHEVDLEVAARHFPQDIIYGNIEPAVMQEGSPQQVYELSRVAIEKGRKAQGGFILGPSCDIPAATPPINAFAVTKAVNDFGWYE